MLYRLDVDSLGDCEKFFFFLKKKKITQLKGKKIICKKVHLGR